MFITYYSRWIKKNQNWLKTDLKRSSRRALSLIRHLLTIFVTFFKSVLLSTIKGLVNILLPTKSNRIIFLFSGITGKRLSRSFCCLICYVCYSLSSRCAGWMNKCNINAMAIRTTTIIIHHHFSLIPPTSLSHPGIHFLFPFLPSFQPNVALLILSLSLSFC